MHRTLVAFCLARNEIQQGARRSRNPAFFRDFSWESGTLSRAFLSSCMPYFLFSSTLRPVPSLLCVAKEVSAAERELGMAEKKKKKRQKENAFVLGQRPTLLSHAHTCAPLAEGSSPHAPLRLAAGGGLGRVDEMRALFSERSSHSDNQTEWRRNHVIRNIVVWPHVTANICGPESS